MRLARAYPNTFQIYQIVHMIKWLLKKRIGKNYCKDPMQYTLIISFPPPANKTWEMHRINLLVVEIGYLKNRDRLYLTKHNSRLIKIVLDFKETAKKKLCKIYCWGQVQYTRLISFTPPANKPGELHRIIYWSLRLSRTSPNTIPATLIHNDIAKQIL